MSTKYASTAPAIDFDRDDLREQFQAIRAHKEAAAEAAAYRVGEIVTATPAQRRYHPLTYCLVRPNPGLVLPAVLYGRHIVTKAKGRGRNYRVLSRRLATAVTVICWPVRKTGAVWDGPETLDELTATPIPDTPAVPVTMLGFTSSNGGDLVRVESQLQPQPPPPVHRSLPPDDEFEVGQVVCSTIQRYSHHRYVVTRKSRACGMSVMFGKLLSPTGRELEPEVLLGRWPYKLANQEAE